MMWRNYLTVGLRALTRDPLFAAINLFGLAIGLAGCLMIILFIRYELSFDDWLPDADLRERVLVRNPSRLYWRDMQQA